MKGEHGRAFVEGMDGSVGDIKKTSLNKWCLNHAIKKKKKKERYREGRRERGENEKGRRQETREGKVPSYGEILTSD